MISITFALSCTIYSCVTSLGQIKEAARTLRKQDPSLLENRAIRSRVLNIAVIKPKKARSNYNINIYFYSA